MIDSLLAVKINDYEVVFIFWNFFLALIPIFLWQGVEKTWRQAAKKKTRGLNKIIFSALTSLLVFVWLLFIPNAAYIITDARHLSTACQASARWQVCGNHSWYIILFFTYAVCGWIIMVYALRQAEAFLIKRFNKKAALIAMLVLLPLIALGVLLGLVNRWNSWEFFLYPLPFLKNSLIYILDKDYLLNWLIFSFCLYILYFSGRHIFRPWKQINKTNLFRKKRK